MCLIFLLVVGPRYIDDDIMVENCHGLDAMASGIVGQCTYHFNILNKIVTDLSVYFGCRAISHMRVNCVTHHHCQLIIIDTQIIFIN